MLSARVHEFAFPGLWQGERKLMCSHSFCLRVRRPCCCIVYLLCARPFPLPDWNPGQWLCMDQLYIPTPHTVLGVQWCLVMPEPMSNAITLLWVKTTLLLTVALLLVREAFVHCRTLGSWVLTPRETLLREPLVPGLLRDSNNRCSQRVLGKVPYQDRVT